MNGNAARVIEGVREYYGETLETNGDLRTSACCLDESLPSHVKAVLPLIEDEVLAKFYGCGSPIPLALEGCAVLDLGCGSGRDAYLLSKLVGASGSVLGIDMTEQQLSVARGARRAQMEKFGYSEPNVDFLSGYIEDLAAAGVKELSQDLVVSNCVLNLSPDKKRVFSEIYRVLKDGGELYFSDVFADRRVPEEHLGDPLLRGECLSGALYSEDFRRVMSSVGFQDFRVVSKREIALDDPEVQKSLGMIKFYSMTIRAFKLNSLEDRCEDYGQIATYLGSIPESKHSFVLDDHHEFMSNKPHLVCGNTASMLSETRYQKHFHIQGDRSTHFGLFDCGDDSPSSPGPGSCC